MISATRRTAEWIVDAAADAAQTIAKPPSVKWPVAMMYTRHDQNVIHSEQSIGGRCCTFRPTKGLKNDLIASTMPDTSTMKTTINVRQKMSRSIFPIMKKYFCFYFLDLVLDCLMRATKLLAKLSIRLQFQVKDEDCFFHFGKMVAHYVLDGTNARVVFIHYGVMEGVFAFDISIMPNNVGGFCGCHSFVRSSLSSICSPNSR